MDNQENTINQADEILTVDATDQNFDKQILTSDPNSGTCPDSVPSLNPNSGTSPEPDSGSGLESDFNTLCAALDGLLLVQNRPVSIERLAQAMEVTPERAGEVVDARKLYYENNDKSGLQIVILDSGVQLATKATISPFIQRLDGQKLVSLSLPALETLAVIGFKQPLTKAEIDAIRGVNSDGVISTLLEKKLIYVSGEKPVLGRPRLYSTTQDFLYYFGMKSLKELPVPSVEIPMQLTPEGQKMEKQEELNETRKELNESQGLMPIPDESSQKDEPVDDF